MRNNGEVSQALNEETGEEEWERSRREWQELGGVALTAEGLTSVDEEAKTVASTEDVAADFAEVQTLEQVEESEAEFETWFEAQSAEFLAASAEYLAELNAGRDPNSAEMQQLDHEVLQLEYDLIERCMHHPRRLEHIYKGLGLDSIGLTLSRLNKDYPEAVFSREMFAEVCELAEKKFNLNALDTQDKTLIGVRQMENALCGHVQLTASDPAPMATPAGFRGFFNIVEDVAASGIDYEVKPDTYTAYCDAIKYLPVEDEKWPALGELLTTQWAKGSLLEVANFCVRDLGGAEALQENWQMFQDAGVEFESYDELIQKYAMLYSEENRLEELLYYPDLYATQLNFLNRCTDWVAQHKSMYVVSVQADELRRVGVKLDEAALQAYQSEWEKMKVPELEEADFSWEALPEEVQQASAQNLAEAKAQLEEILTLDLWYGADNGEGKTQQEIGEDYAASLISELKRVWHLDLPLAFSVAELAKSRLGEANFDWYKQSDHTEGDTVIEPRSWIRLNADGVVDLYELSNTVVHECWHVWQFQKMIKSANGEITSPEQEELAKYYRANKLAYQTGNEDAQGVAASYDAYRNQLMEHEAWEIGDYATDVLEEMFYGGYNEDDYDDEL